MLLTAHFPRHPLAARKGLTAGQVSSEWKENVDSKNHSLNYYKNTKITTANKIQAIDAEHKTMSKLSNFFTFITFLFWFNPQRGLQSPPASIMKTGLIYRLWNYTPTLWRSPTAWETAPHPKVRSYPQGLSRWKKLMLINSGLEVG